MPEILTAAEIPLPECGKCFQLEESTAVVARVLKKGCADGRLRTRNAGFASTVSTKMQTRVLTGPTAVKVSTLSIALSKSAHILAMKLDTTEMFHDNAG